MVYSLACMACWGFELVMEETALCRRGCAHEAPRPAEKFGGELGVVGAVNFMFWYNRANVWDLYPLIHPDRVLFEMRGKPSSMSLVFLVPHRRRRRKRLLALQASTKHDRCAPSKLESPVLRAAPAGPPGHQGRGQPSMRACICLMHSSAATLARASGS